MKLSKVIEGFIVAKSPDGYSKHTINIYRQHFRQLQAYLTSDPPLTGLQPQQVTEQPVNQVAQYGDIFVFTDPASSRPGARLAADEANLFGSRSSCSFH